MNSNLKNANIAIFIPHSGCKNECSFCNQRNITEKIMPATPRDVEEILTKAAHQMGQASKNAEIAFFGGSFTAIPREYMLSLLKAAEVFLKNGSFKGIRISTRPDAIDREILELLKMHGVTSVELGAQSMDDTVLRYNRRGHTTKDVVIASTLIKETGLSLGLQMMTGLYKSTPEKDYETALKIKGICPDTLRIYPTVVLPDTYLADLLRSGEYKPYDFDKTVDLCAKIIELFENGKTRIIRLGLHDSEGIKNTVLAGAYHPAFRELCESRLMLLRTLNIIEKNDGKGEITVQINSRSVSKFIGQKKSNLQYLEKNGYKLNIKINDELTLLEVKPCF